jgi:nucleolar protein 4
MSDEVVEKKQFTKKINKKESSEDPHAKLTLFVRGLPFDATSKDLEDFFGEIGPIRKCFVVTDRSTEEEKKEDAEVKAPVKNKGFGYVHYALEEDAQSAITKLKNVKFMGRKLKIELAKRKSETVREDTKKSAAVEKKVVEPKKPAEPLNFDVNARLIVRNLPWKYREADLRKLFEAYGTVHDVKLPRKYEGGPLRGFAFIQFEKVEEGKAVSLLYGADIISI